MLKILFISVFITGILILFRVKFLLKKYYPVKHDELFGKNIIDHSVSTSIRFIRFSLIKNEWGIIDNNKLLFWLRIYRVVAMIFYGIGVCGLIYMLFIIAIELLE